MGTGNGVIEDVQLLSLSSILKPNDVKPRETLFGYSLAWHTNDTDSFLAVGASSYDACDIDSTGAVYIYKKDENGLCDQYHVKLQPNDKPNSGANPRDTDFGWSLAWQSNGSDSFLAVGAIFHDACDGIDDSTGAVYIYKNVESMSGECDNHHVKLQPNDKPDSGAHTHFGSSLAWHTDGTDSFLAVGARDYDACDGKLDDTGAIYIYKDVENMSGVCDNHLVKLQPNDKPDSGANPKDTQFGFSLAWHNYNSDSFLAVGAPYHDACDGCDENTGAVYVYKDVESMSGVCDVHLVKLEPYDKANNVNQKFTYFGWSLAWHNDGSDSFLAVGTILPDACDSGSDNTGAVYIYNDVESMSGVCDNHLVKLQPNDKPNDADPRATYFGWSLAWHTDGTDSFLAVGAILHDACDVCDDNTGAVYIYKDVENMSGVCDVHLVKLQPNDKPNDADPKTTYFGNSLAWHSNGNDSFLAVGASWYDACDSGVEENTGAVYVYDVNEEAAMI